MRSTESAIKNNFVIRQRALNCHGRPNHFPPIFQQFEYLDSTGAGLGQQNILILTSIGIAARLPACWAWPASVVSCVELMQKSLIVDFGSQGFPSQAFTP